MHLESENLHQRGQLLRRVRVPEVYPPAGAAEGRRGQQRSVGGEVTGGQEVQGLPGSSRQVAYERIRAQAPQANHLRGGHRSVKALMSIILRKLFSVTASGTGWSMQLTVKKKQKQNKVLRVCCYTTCGGSGRKKESGVLGKTTTITVARLAQDGQISTFIQNDQKWKC